VRLPELSPRSGGSEPTSTSSSRAREDMRRRLQFRTNRARLAVVLEGWANERLLRIDRQQLTDALRKMDIEANRDHIEDLFRTFDVIESGRIDVRVLHDALWWGKRDPRGAAAARLLAGAQSYRDATLAEEARSPREPTASERVAMFVEPHAAPGRARPAPPRETQQLRRPDAKALQLFRQKSAAVVVDSAPNAVEPREVERAAAARRLEQLCEAAVRNNRRLMEALTSYGLRADSLVAPSDLHLALRSVGLRPSERDSEALYWSWAMPGEEGLKLVTVRRVLQTDGGKRAKPKPPPKPSPRRAQEAQEADQAAIAKRIKKELRKSVVHNLKEGENEQLLKGMGHVKDHMMGMFRKWDKDRSGWIGRDELRRAVAELGLPARKADIDALFTLMDPDGTEQIQLDEMARMLRWAYSNRKTNSILSSINFVYRRELGTSMAEQLCDALVQIGGRVIDLFKEWDEDRDGNISKKEFRRAMSLLGTGATKTQIEEVFDWFDIDRSGVISLKELERILRPSFEKTQREKARKRAELDDTIGLVDIGGLREEMMRGMQFLQPEKAPEPRRKDAPQGGDNNRPPNAEKRRASSMAKAASVMAGIDALVRETEAAEGPPGDAADAEPTPRRSRASIWFADGT